MGKKRDHFNPVLLLNRFADRDGVLHVFDKRHAHLGVREFGPRDTYVHKHLYSEIKQDGSRHRELDDFYTELESIAAPVIDRIVKCARQRRTPNLSPEEKKIWDLFLYNQWRRVPDSYQRFNFSAADVQALLTEYERRYRSLTESERLYWAQPETIVRLQHNAYVDVLKKQSSQVLDILHDRGLGIAVITKQNKSFVTGSFPVVKLTNPETPQLDHPTTEVWIALAPDVAVTPAGTRGSESIMSIADYNICALNEALLRQSTSIASRSKELVESLTKQCA